MTVRPARTVCIFCTESVWCVCIDQHRPAKQDRHVCGTDVFLQCAQFVGPLSNHAFLGAGHHQHRVGKVGALEAAVRAVFLCQRQRLLDITLPHARGQHLQRIARVDRHCQARPEEVVAFSVRQGSRTLTKHCPLAQNRELRLSAATPKCQCLPGPMQCCRAYQCSALTKIALPSILI